MKKRVWLILAVAVLALVNAPSGYAGGGYYHGGGHHGGGYYGGGYYGGWGYRGGVWIGPGYGAWGPGWGVWGPGWWGSVYPYYAPPVIIEQQPQLYVAPQPQPQPRPQPQPDDQSYWYYCQDPQGYYPYVKKCPQGWMKVVPTPTPPQGEE